MITLSTQKMSTGRPEMKTSHKPAQARVNLAQKPDSFTSSLSFKGNNFLNGLPRFLGRLFEAAEAQEARIIQNIELSAGKAAGTTATPETSPQEIFFSQLAPFFKY